MLIEMMSLRNPLIKLFVRETWFLSIKLNSTLGQILLMAKMKLCFKMFSNSNKSRFQKKCPHDNAVVL